VIFCCSSFSLCDVISSIERVQRLSALNTHLCIIYFDEDISCLLPLHIALCGAMCLKDKISPFSHPTFEFSESTSTTHQQHQEKHG